jgi:hypothetical protein
VTTQDWMAERAVGRIAGLVIVPQSDGVSQRSPGEVPCSNHHGGTTMEHYAGIERVVGKLKHLCGRRRWPDHPGGKGEQRSGGADLLVQWAGDRFGSDRS